MMGTLAPPAVTVEWDPTALGTNFGAYRVYRRAARTPARPWTLIAELDVPDGYTAATVEAQHTTFVDYAAGWAATEGAYTGGWDYAVTVLNAVTGLESLKATVSGVTVDAGGAGWVTCNAAPWLNFPLVKANRLTASDSERTTVYEPVGRDHAVTRTRSELAARRWAIQWRHIGFGGEDPGRVARAAAASGRQVTALTARGDRLEGTLLAPSHQQTPDPLMEVDATIVETGADPALAGINVPAGLMLDGTADHVTTPDHADLDPATGAFTVLVAAAFEDAAVGHLTKGNVGTSAGWGIVGNGTGAVLFVVTGATATASAGGTDTAWFDGDVHVASATSTGTAQALYLDGTLAASSATTTGTVTNSAAITAGANNGGAAGFSELAPLRAWAYWPRALTAAEHLAAARYLHGHVGHRMPAGATLMFDLRDNRCWNGATSRLTDLTGNAHTATVVSAPPTRGVPWPLADLDRWS